MATVFRQPIVTKFQPLDPAGISVRSEGEVWENRLQNLLQGQDTFFGTGGQTQTYDYPNPKGRDYSIDLRTWLQTPFNELLATIKPFMLNDWPNPAGYQYPQLLRTFLNQLELELLGQDQFFGPAGMGPKYDYPNPGIAQRNAGQSGYIQFVYPYYFPIPPPPPVSQTQSSYFEPPRILIRHIMRMP